MIPATEAKSSPLNTTARCLLSGDIDKLRSPNYHTLNKHNGRNDRLLHAVMCAYVKHHYYEDDDIGWDELDEILFNAITNEIGDDAFCDWVDKLPNGVKT